MPHGASLAGIIALARAGALDRAWESLKALTDGMPVDADTASLIARLLKDRAALESGARRRELYRESAAAYRQSAELHPATYPLINAASISLLLGDAEQAAGLACQVL